MRMIIVGNLVLLLILDNSHEKIIITNDDIDYSTSTVRHIKLKDFLLMDSLDEK